MKRDIILREVKMHQQLAAHHNNEATKLLEKLEKEDGVATTASPRKGLSKQQIERLQLNLRKSLYKIK